MSSDAQNLAGRRALITGAGGGIGRSCAQHFAELGCRVVVADLEEVSLAQTLSAMRPHASGHGLIRFDLADPAACEDSVEHAAEKLGGLDVLIHAGALLLREPLDRVSAVSLQKTTAVNMWGSFFVARRAARLMAASGGGSIVLFLSQGAYTGGYGNSTVYSMTKAAVAALVKSLARDFAREGVRVNGIAPGAIDTQMLRRDMSEEALAKFMQLIPMQRVGAPLEVATCCAFLASSAAQYMTGQVLHVNGGQLML